MPAGRWKDLTKAVERKKAQIRARVELPFHVVKNLFGHKKTRYKGLAKNTAQMFSLFGLANLVIAKKPLLAFQGATRLEYANRVRKGARWRACGSKSGSDPSRLPHGENQTPNSRRPPARLLLISNSLGVSRT